MRLHRCASKLRVRFPSEPLEFVEIINGHPFWLVFGSRCTLEIGGAIAEAIVAKGEAQTIGAVFVLVPWREKCQVRS